ncbi:single-stranded DNA-binding protein [Nocardioides sp.]|jgi:single-strand DNA-binding protein|uniref:single-stranded DNA-binding protein n=1 Tax=Nocardioides sp. TaxID=35761 RepID=UPI0031FF4237|nr:single-strand binding protein/Primosomal replication protein n [Nocardioides sp.]
MSAQTVKKQKDAPVEVGSASGSGLGGNAVRLVGRISQPPEQRVLPSGDTMWTFRVVVPRTGPPGRSRQTVDALECTVWAGRIRRSVATWGVDDVVEVTGALRRRFFRASGSAVSRVEVEVTGGRLIRRAASA